ncbi:MAG: signal peptidase I [Polyangiales bacterium]
MDSAGRARVKPWLTAVLVAMSIATVAVILSLRTMFVSYQNPSGSMIPTLLPGDYMIIRQGAPQAIARGEVVVFEAPGKHDQLYVKRVVGLGGDTVEVRDGRAWVNGKAIPRCHIGTVAFEDAYEDSVATKLEGEIYLEMPNGTSNGSYLIFLTKSAPPAQLNDGPFHVSSGEVFVLGDNRNNSLDSREWSHRGAGAVMASQVQGRPRWIGKSREEGRFLQSINGPPKLPQSMRAQQSAFDRCVGPNPPLDF